MTDVLGHVLLDLDADLQKAGATVHVRRPLPVVDADPVLLRQLLQNLIANAVAHRDPDRECRIDTSSARATVRARDPEVGWTIAVVDHGRGVPAEDRERVFGMFTRRGRQRREHGVPASASPPAHASSSSTADASGSRRRPAAAPPSASSSQALRQSRAVGGRVAWTGHRRLTARDNVTPQGECSVGHPGSLFSRVRRAHEEGSVPVADDPLAGVSPFADFVVGG